MALSVTASAMMAFFLAQAGGNGLVAFLPLVIIMVIFYVLLILPAQRRQKKTQAMLNALKNGDKVVTSGGLYGTIVGLEPDAVQLRIAEQVKVKVARSAIADIQSDIKEERG
jgi:preprotein translocase subunit YajC